MLSRDWCSVGPEPICGRMDVPPRLFGELRTSITRAAPLDLLRIQKRGCPSLTRRPAIDTECVALLFASIEDGVHFRAEAVETGEGVWPAMYLVAMAI